MWRLTEDVNTHEHEFRLPFLNLNVFRDNLTPGKFSYIWQVERARIKAFVS